MVNKTKQDKINLGSSPLRIDSPEVTGGIVQFEGESYYRIENYDKMTSFFMSVVSDSDLWMFISSTGALSAGRKNPDNALFPYYNDDRIHDSQDITGSKTILRISVDKKTYLWEPFSKYYDGIYKITRNIYKRPLGNDIVFEEINHDLKTSFQYAWTSCERFGFVKRSKIYNHNSEPVGINVLDGIQNILPAGVDRGMQLTYSTLLDGYKKNELLADSGVGLYTLSSLLTDKAEPAESLLASMVWSSGLDDATILLSSLQLDAFRQGGTPVRETDIRAQRGAYFLCSDLELAAGESKAWDIIAELKADQSDVAKIVKLNKNRSKLASLINDEVHKSSDNLRRIVARGDAYQLSQDTLTSSRHYSVSLFNIMRGGIFEDNYKISRSDLVNFIRTSNMPLYNKHVKLLNDLPAEFYLKEMSDLLNVQDADLERLCYEYLPLSFSRRHGDPSRPWNDFSIDIKDEQGDRTLNYQGNWRDVFQNWEALALSFPEFIEGMISKFVNSSTPDGYNPYRLTRDGFDWEAPDPELPFANIGYWGDHQIVYLLKLLKLSSKYHPGKLQELLKKDIFSYANVPYRIKAYQDLLKDPHNTIDFDQELHQSIMNEISSFGTDAQRVRNEKGYVYSVNLAEKLLLPALVKLSNYIPGAGIWMNTQRPEWNDANNALVGYGVSMVTLYYLRDYIDFAKSLFGKLNSEKLDISVEVFDLFAGVNETLADSLELLNKTLNDEERKKILDKLGLCGSKHRERIYMNGFSENKKAVSVKELLSFFDAVLKHIDHTITTNRRDDKLYHSYNVIGIQNDAISIRRLYEMLEGQVALLSSGYLSFKESLELLKALRSSKLYRKDQRSYILYPDRELPRFMDKNTIPKTLLVGSSYLMSCLDNDDTGIIQKDISGNIHFNANFSNYRVLKAELEKIQKDSGGIDENDIASILDIYESVFDHQSFTGRSGTFFKYEGLGSIYWHMVSKLLLAVQDTYYRALEANADESILESLKAHYYEIREGIGSHKNPTEYGAFPMDPYSHTPGYSGVQQPGMTGQTKEDMLARAGELGIRVKNGEITFTSSLLDDGEFLSSARVFQYFDVFGKEQNLMLGSRMLAFTLCQIPVIYIKSDMNKIIVTLRDGSEQVLDGSTLPLHFSTSVFQRDDSILKIHVLMKLL